MHNAHGEGAAGGGVPTSLVEFSRDLRFGALVQQVINLMDDFRFFVDRAHDFACDLQRFVQFDSQLFQQPA